MTRKNLIMRISIAVLGGLLLVAAVLGVYHFVKQQEERRAAYPFFYDNRDLFEDIKDEAFLIEGEWWWLSENGDVYINGNTFWYPGLSENVVRYYALVVGPRPSIRGSGSSGEQSIDFEFYDEVVGVMYGYTYREDTLPSNFYTRIEGNWYYYQYGTI